MTHGNAHIFRWVRLCLFGVAAVFLTVAADATPTAYGTASGGLSSSLGPVNKANVTVGSVADNGDGTQLIVHFTTDMNFGGSVELSALVTYSDASTRTVPISYGAGQTVLTFSTYLGKSPQSVHMVPASPWNTQAYPDWGNPGISGHIDASLAPPQTQTCSVVGVPSEIANGTNVHGQASGSRGGNLYFIQVQSGPIVASINTTTGYISITGGGTGEGVIYVWIGAGNGYAESNHVRLDISSGASLFVSVTLPANPSDYPVTYTLKQNGQSIGSATQEPHATAKIFSLPVETDSPVTVSEHVPGLYVDHGIWTNEPNPAQNPNHAVDFDLPDQIIPQRGTPNNMPAPVPVPHPPIPNSVNPDKPLAPVIPPSPNPNQNAPIWSSDGGNPDALTKGVYMQGVDKLYSKLSNIDDNTKNKNGGGASGSDLLTNTHFDEKVKEMHTDTKDVAVAQKEGVKQMDDNGLRTTGYWQGMAQTAFDAHKTKAEEAREVGKGVVDQFGAVPSSSAEPAAPLSDGVTLDLGGGRTAFIPANPFSSSGPFGGIMADVAAFVRRLIAWGIVAAFFIWCLGKIRAMVAAPFNVQPFRSDIADKVAGLQALGNSAGLIMWPLVKVFIFVLLIVVILTLPVAVMAAVTAGLPWSGLASTFAAGPVASGGSGMIANAISIANCVVPWTLLLFTPCYYFLVEAVLFPSQFFWMVFMKLLPV